MRVKSFAHVLATLLLEMVVSTLPLRLVFGDGVGDVLGDGAGAVSLVPLEWSLED